MTSIQNYIDLEILGLGEVEEGEGSQEEEEDGHVHAVGVASCHHAALGVRVGTCEWRLTFFGHHLR